MSSVIPQEDAVRKAAPMFRGLLGYFPWALFRVAAHSFRSDRKHNPEKPASEAPHWRREASTDHADAIVRHLAEMHTDPDYHLTAIAWRALALLQEHGEKVHGAAPGARSVFPAKERRNPLIHPAQQMVLDAKENERQNAILRAGIEMGERIATTIMPPGKYEAFDGSTVEIKRDPFAGLRGGPDDFGGSDFQPTEPQP